MDKANTQEKRIAALEERVAALAAQVTRQNKLLQAIDKEVSRRRLAVDELDSRLLPLEKAHNDRQGDFK